MTVEVRQLRIGPSRNEWPQEPPDGDCAQCGGECNGGDCGKHEAGCLYGGFTEQTSYWMIADGCPLYHGEPR